VNWYKRLIKFCQVKYSQKRDLTYMDIGHSEDNYLNDVLWVFYNGNLLIKFIKEAKGSYVNHWQKFPNISGWGSIYYGRYEGDTGKLSVQKPIVGVQQFKEIPNFLKQKLRQKFPKITEILEF